jgi:hypothetical protein
MKHSPDGELVLYGVVGFERGRGGWRSRSGLAINGRERRVVQQSESLRFDGPDGGSVTVSTHSRDGIQWDQARASALMNPYLASPRGRAAHEGWNRVDPIPRPENVEWTPVTISVDGQRMPFETCDLGDGYWAAIGEVPGAIVTVDSRGVSVSAVGLERLASREPPPPSAPDIGDRTAAVITSLDERFTRVPFDRVHRWADYWALRDCHQTTRPPRGTPGEGSQSAGVLLVNPDRNPRQQHFGAVAVQTGGKVASRSIHYSPGIWILVPALVSHGGARRQDLVRESLCRHPALHIPAVVASLSPHDRAAPVR